jgi:hypothetical protein
MRIIFWKIAWNRKLNGGPMERIFQFRVFFKLMINHKLMFRSHKVMCCMLCYVMKNHKVLQY